jgi:Fusaric acid resistance protein-like
VDTGASDVSVARFAHRLNLRASLASAVPTWSPPAAIRAARAAVVMPSLFVLTDQVIGNLQMALFAAFGSFATLVLANFAGSRRDKLIAHTGLAVSGSVLLIIGTSVSSSTLLAALVTVPVGFAVFFAGIAGPNAASSVTAALLIYVLPAASPGTVSMIPDRLVGWWMASVAGTLAVLAFPTPSAGGRLRAALANVAMTVADEIDAVLAGTSTPARLEACIQAKHELFAEFNSAPLRPTGLAVPDQALANSVELLEWCTALLVDSVHERDDLREAPSTAREVLFDSAVVLRQSAALFTGGKEWPALGELEESRERYKQLVMALEPASDDFRAQAQLSFHVNALAVTALAIAADAVVSARLAGPDWLAEARARWYGSAERGPGDARHLTGVAKYRAVLSRHTSLRSVWFINSLRGAIALAAAVAVADLSNVQHGFWVVLGTLSVLRTNASATGATALRALLGTVIGFVVGFGLLEALGTTSGALWAALPFAVAIAAYAPGTTPFAVGQAAFTVTVAVLFNLLQPVGWSVGVLRIEDVAIGCLVSVVVGLLFWPRGVSGVVGNDLAEVYRAGASYLSNAVRWATGMSGAAPPTSRRAIEAGLRLEEALRGFIAEQGTKHVPKEQLWRLVGGSLRLRLTAHAVATLPPDRGYDPAVAEAVLGRRTDALDEFYERLAAQVGRPHRGGNGVVPLAPPEFDGEPVENHAVTRQSVWLCEHLDHLTEHLHELVAPAAAVAEVRRRPWWR